VPDALVITPETQDAEIDRLASLPWFETVDSAATFAVRSSGLDEDGRGHSFAGIHETELDVPRSGVARAVRRCRASAQSRLAATYRQARGIEARGIAVLVQVMVRARASGVAFTLNPATGADEIVIDSAFGLGEALVSGRIDPDEYVVAKGDRSIRS